MKDEKTGGISMDHLSVGCHKIDGGERFYFKVYLTTYFFDEITKIERATRGCYLYFFDKPRLYLTNWESVYLAARMGDAMETIPWQ